jgi:hypothetical protein
MSSKVPPFAEDLSKVSRHLKELYGWFETRLPGHEPEAAKGYAPLHRAVKDLIDRHAEHFTERYPDLGDINALAEREQAGRIGGRDVERAHVHEGNERDKDGGADMERGHVGEILDRYHDRG